MGIPRLYAIADRGALERFGLGLREYAEALAAGGVTLIQYRDKDAQPQSVLRSAAVITGALSSSSATLILNDRADLAVLAGWDGVHVGQGDLSPEDAKTVLAALKNPRLRGETWAPQIGGGILGVSTHTDIQVIAAETGAADYVAIGPVFATGTKLDASPVVGLDGVRRARALTAKPLVAIGGITRANASSVIKAGADSVAVIGGLLVPGEKVEKVARDFIQLLR
jgi:thiamine-phosphate pyrophosphorylase